MAVATDNFTTWIEQADIPRSRLTPQLEALLQAVYRFRQQQGTDYYSTRLLSHFLLHADTKLKVAQIARLLGISRPKASKHKKLSSKEAIQQAHHRMDGRPSGKLLPRYAGPIAAYLLGHPTSSRADLLDFIYRTFDVRVSRIALYKFLKKYGLNDVTHPPQAATQAPAQTKAPVDTAAPSSPESPPATVADSAAAGVVASAVVAPAPMLVPAPAPAPAPVIELASALGCGKPSAPPFCTDGRNTAAPSC
jgi:hypothetical protein